ncbi:YbfB/YjiJ family MFS transporter [Roseospira marina]|uniref:YbfB/YjiJ family MFS transporter n=1 Tax=Roseospira marina TaxID=140057 RepID=A0A5M6I772_9PROT|nr:YbfB/YjiJ family MFS transporter [Roseospira marina]KAA5603952.1 YbfB/YjiJ family MFS transporter [Roseospira marina]MBB4315919.1 putative MFS family arabinose efflux permease [Roseospira marina]MBB5089119.1 putative MFS family arabinose efflux permease [Roseospira marina]
MPIRADAPALLTGLLSTLAGIGMARFAYSALLPAIIDAGWFGPSAAAYLGAANLLGYLVGAVSGHALSERLAPRRLVGLCFVGIVLSFVLCAVPGPFAWFLVWRVVSGVAGAILMVVGPSLALTTPPPERRKAVGALVFTGIGLGALVSATLVPLLLLASGPTAAWLVLGGVCALAGVACDRALDRLPARPAPVDAPARAPGGGVSTIVALVVAAYALDAVGFVPHTVFWVDYLAREAGLGGPAASLQWALFGVGAILGPLAASVAVRHLGWHRSLCLAYLIKALAVAAPLLSLAVLPRSLSSLLVGAMVPGIVALTSGRLAELVGPHAHKRLWGQATVVFAVAQALAGYGMTGVYDHLGTFAPLFAIGGAVLVVGFGLVALSPTLGGRAMAGAPSGRRS